MPNIKVALRVRPLSQREVNENYPVVIAVENNSAFITDIRVPERSSADSRPRFRQFDFDHAFWFRTSGSGSSSPLQKNFYENNGRRNNNNNKSSEHHNQNSKYHYCHKGSTFSHINSKSSSLACNGVVAGVASAATQSEVYDKMGPSLEKAILAGYNACLLAYGQSGSGKTYTMIGTREDYGIIPRFCKSLWDKLQATHPPQPNGKSSFRLDVSFVEIYREKVRDLLNPDKVLKLREHPQLGPHVQGLTRVEVTGETALLDLLWEGERRRALGNTTSNRCSSRSHAIWTLYLTVFTYPSPSTTKTTLASSSSYDNEISSSSSESHESISGSRYGNKSVGGIKTKDNCSNVAGRNAGREQRMRKIITSQVHLVDLAGSEKANCTAAKSLLVEGADINKSLVALGNVISALAEKSQYIPYRDSTLTWLLKDSIGGNASTSIIITASPSSHCHAQTLNSFRFAQRARLVENTPKVNTIPSSSTGNYGPYGFLSVMSVMELKRDISRLARLIKTAHSNGGILRGLVPRSGWTRLIHAIEGIGRVEKEQVKLQSDRAFSEDTALATANSLQEVDDLSTTLPSTSTEDGPSSSSTELSSSPSKLTSPPPSSSSPSSTASASTLTQAKSLNDVMVQADIERKSSRLQNLRRRPSRQSESALPTASSSCISTGPHSPTKIVGTEVFIPTSNSYKCLTWQQEETHPVPKPLSSSNSSLASVSSEESGNDLNSSNPQIHHLKYMLKVNYPVTSNLDHASRISEKIHGVITDEYYQQKTEVIPEEVDDSSLDSVGPLIHDKIPTLVHAQDLDEEMNEQIGDGDMPASPKSILVGQFAKEAKEYLFPSRCKEFANVSLPKGITPFQSSDENEFYEPETVPYGTSYRAIYGKTLERTLSSTANEQNCVVFDETCYFTGVESALSQIPTTRLSSSSSYESIIMPEKVHPVNLVKEFSETKDIEEDYLEEFSVEEKDEVFEEDYEPPVANVCLAAGQPMEIAVPIEILELHQLGQMGKQIKSLLQMTQRCNVVKPYLDEISNLQNSDHSKPDPHLDDHIDGCSGWNVDVELAKVHQEIYQLNKVLKTGLGADGMASSSNHYKINNKSNPSFNSNESGNAAASKNVLSSTLYHTDQATTSDGGEADESSSIDRRSQSNSLSFARTRQIPLLGTGSKTFLGRKYETDFSGSSSPARKSSSILLSSITQPQFSVSSSSSNNSLPSGTTFTHKDSQSHYYLPNISSTNSLEGNHSLPPYMSHSRGRDEDDGKVINDFSKMSSYPTTFRPLNFENFATSSKSMETFYGNSDGIKGTRQPSMTSSSVWDSPSSKSCTSATHSSSSTSNSNSCNTHTSSEGFNSLNYSNIPTRDALNSHSMTNVRPGRVSSTTNNSGGNQFSNSKMFGTAVSRKSESCTNFQRNYPGYHPQHFLNQNPNFRAQQKKFAAFNTEEIRSHGQLYENKLVSPEPGKQHLLTESHSEREFLSLMAPIRKEAWELYTKSGETMSSLPPFSYHHNSQQNYSLGETTSSTNLNPTSTCTNANCPCAGASKNGKGINNPQSSFLWSPRSQSFDSEVATKKHLLNTKGKLQTNVTDPRPYETPFEQRPISLKHPTNSSSDGETSNGEPYRRHQPMMYSPPAKHETS